MQIRFLIIQLFLALVFIIPDSSLAQQPAEQDTVSSNLVIDEKDQEEMDFETYQFSEKEPGEKISSVAIKKIPDSLISDLKKDKAFWYVNTKFDKKKTASESRNSRTRLIDQNWFKNLMWALLIVAFSGALIWFLVSQKVSLFRRKSYQIQNDNQELSGENIFEINYGNAIYQAVSSGDFRMAVRYRFLQILKILSEKDKIRYQQELTNFHYQSQLYDTPYYTDFKSLARHFEFVWYGDYPLTENQYHIISKDFEIFLNKPGLRY